MEFDEIVIGSGLAALATVLGLPRAQRTLVIGGPDPGRSCHYDPVGSVPCAHVGYGGLGNYWHGVIPTGYATLQSDRADFIELFRYFYPQGDVEGRLGEQWLFVPWRAIRPRREWARLAQDRGERLSIAHETVTRFAVGERSVVVHTQRGTYGGRRVWVCAGALHTPFLLERSLGGRIARESVSDHVICYVGQVDRRHHGGVALPRVERRRSGVWFQAWGDGTALCTLRPAHFDFRPLDQGIEQRAVFGLPTGSIVKKILRRATPGLLAEALYNRAGLLQNARVQSVYAQVAVPDAYWLRDGDEPLATRVAAVQAALRRARAACSRPEWVPSRRPEMFIPAIHLHHSVDLNALRAAGVNTPGAAVLVTDASVCADIGPAHHSFRVMVAAFRAARDIADGVSIQ